MEPTQPMDVENAEENTELGFKKVVFHTKDGKKVEFNASNKRKSTSEKQAAKKAKIIAEFLKEQRKLDRLAKKAEKQEKQVESS